MENIKVITRIKKKRIKQKPFDNNLIGGFLSILIANSIAATALNTAFSSIGKSGLLNKEKENEQSATTAS